jgi:putative addiction module component (TIGR02574 family)
MPVTIQSLGIDKLSVVERLDLIEQIWASLPDQVQLEEIPPWHLVELSKRLAEAEAAPGAGQPWREALAELERFNAEMDAEPDITLAPERVRASIEDGEKEKQHGK